ncbi:MAG: peroxidase-related enzyme [Rhodospirillaceae bacterium]|nr:peroxidase-related enzyme [Rhodospirillaceae bacterium]
MPQPDHVMALPVPAGDPDDPALARYYGVCRDKLGFVPNVLRAFQSRPSKLATFSQLYNEAMLGDSGLSKLEREMIAVVVSSANHCYYCLVAHGQAVRALSGDPQLGEMLVMNYRVAPLSDRQRAMLDFAWDLTLKPQEVDGGERRALLHKVGFSDDDIFDIADIVGLFNLSNRVAITTDMMPNPEYHTLNRTTDPKD